jgi:hypothetical protein
MLFDLRHPQKVLQYLDMDSKSSNTQHMSDMQLYAAQFNKSMLTNHIKVLAAGGTGQRNEIKFFEAPPGENEAPGSLTGGFRGTHRIDEFPGGV